MQLTPANEPGKREVVQTISEGNERLPFGRRATVLTMIGILLVLFLSALDQTIIATALPRIVADLQGFSQIAWVTTTYLLTMTVTIPLYGKLSDLLGRKPIFLFGIVVFLCGSVLSGVAQSMEQLIIFRGLQGIGAGGLQPIASAVVGDLFPPRERGKWQGVTGSMYALASIAGPLAGGWLTDHLSWRWIFYINLPIGIAAMLVLTFLMPMLRAPMKRVFIDSVGTLLLVLGTVSLLLSLIWGGNQYVWSSPQIIGLIACAVVVLTLLVFYEAHLERQGKEPIFEPSLFKASIRIFSVSLLVTMIFSIGLIGVTYYIPLFIQGVVGASATNSGLVIIPLAATAIVGSILSGTLISFTGRYKWIALLGVVIAVVGSLLLVRLNAQSGYGDVLAGMLVLGLGMGSGMAVYIIIVQNALSDKIGQATAMLAFFRQLGWSASAAVMGSVVTSSYVPAFHAALSSRLSQKLPASVIATFDNPLVVLTPGVLDPLRESFSRSGSRGSAAFNELLDAVKVGLAQSIHNAFVLSLIILLVALVVVCFLKEIPLRKRHDKEEAQTMF